MAIVEDIPDEPRKDDGLRHRIPLTHPSATRKDIPLKPLIDLGLPSSTQSEVLEAINASFNEPNRAARVDNDFDEDEEELEEDDFDPTAYAEEGDDLDFSGEHTGAHQCVVEEPDANELFWDEFFDSLIITVPFTFLYILLDILVHLQYQHRPTTSQVISHAAKAAPTLGVIVFYTNRHIAHPLALWLLTATSILSGARLIWLVNKAGWSLTTNQAPPMGTLWILTIVQLPLPRAILALSGLAAWTYYSGLKIMP